jgi:prophage DNA circulation protein
MSEKRFVIDFPTLYKEKWREAYRSDKDDNPRLSSYQAPDGNPIPFIYKSLDFSGGQAVDTAEYPFFGLWSNESLNQKPQTITVHGYLRGEYYLQQRADLLDALTVSTSDDDPGFFDHPLWGRFKVVVENYTVMESANENGQCELTLTLKRAGVSLESRAREISPQELAKPKDAAGTATGIFAKINAEYKTMLQGFGVIKAQLLTIIGTLQLPQNMLNGIINEIAGIANLIAQGIQTPMLLAQALVNSVFSITAAVVSVEESVNTTIKYFSDRNNKKNAALNFLAARSWTLPFESATAQQEETKKASENLYRIVSLCAAAEIMMSMENVTRSQMDGYWALYIKLENAISLEDPDMYQAIVEMRAALSAKLRQNDITYELKKTLEKPVPLLFLAHYLDCDSDQLRTMNFIEDSFLISGEVSYV